MKCLVQWNALCNETCSDWNNEWIKWNKPMKQWMSEMKQDKSTFAFWTLVQCQLSPASFDSLFSEGRRWGRCECGWRTGVIPIHGCGWQRAWSKQPLCHSILHLGMVEQGKWGLTASLLNSFPSLPSWNTIQVMYSLPFKPSRGLTGGHQEFSQTCLLAATAQHLVPGSAWMHPCCQELCGTPGSCAEEMHIRVLESCPESFPQVPQNVHQPQISITHLVFVGSIPTVKDLENSICKV